MALFPLGILSAAGAGGVQGDYELIESNILGSSQASITFSNLGDFASTYKHLQLRVVLRSDRGSNIERVDIQYNGDTATNYSVHELQGTGSAVGSVAYTNTNTIYSGYVTGASNLTNVFGSHVIDILDPYSTTKNTTQRSLGGYSATTPYVLMFSGAWRNTAAISSILIKPFGGTVWVTGSRFSLYGIKG
jgi:hypothetical protein